MIPDTFKKKKSCYKSSKRTILVLSAIDLLLLLEIKVAPANVGHKKVMQSFLSIFERRRFPNPVFSDLHICLHADDMSNHIENATCVKNTHAHVDGA